MCHTVQWKSLSHVWLFVIPWTVACRAPLSMGILHARILEWVAMPSSGGSSQPRELFSSVQSLSRVWLFATPWFSIDGILQARILEWVAMPFSRGFQTQGSNPGLPRCWRILYCLSHQGSPRICVIFFVRKPLFNSLSNSFFGAGLRMDEHFSTWVHGTLKEWDCIRFLLRERVP